MKFIATAFVLFMNSIVVVLCVEDGVIDVIDTIGNQMCLNRCGQISVCLSVEYNKEKLRCKLLSAPSVNKEITPTQLWNGTECQKRIQVNVCEETIQSVYLSSGKLFCLPKEQYRNVALRKPANLSSVWRSDSDAFNAVDGIGIVTVSGPEHCAHSDGYERNPHLTIDLQNLFYIDHLLLLTRGDTSAEFFHDVEVRIGNLTIWEEMKTCGLFSETAELGQWYKIQCASCLVGRFVTIKITGDRMMTDHDGNLLSLCEVSVWGRRYYNS